MSFSYKSIYKSIAPVVLVSTVEHFSFIQAAEDKRDRPLIRNKCFLGLFIP